MSKRVYTDEDKAKVLVMLDANEGNVKRTARDSGVAEQTIRDWKKSAERKGVPAGVQAALPAARSEFVDKAETVRDLMVDELEARVRNGDIATRDLIVGIGVLTEKSLLAGGKATSRTETVQAPPSPEEIGDAIKTYLDRTFIAGAERDADIVLSDEDISEAEWEQAPVGELPVSTS